MEDTNKLWKEHDCLDSEYTCKPLCIGKDKKNNDIHFFDGKSFSYFIGAQWLETDEGSKIPFVVNPKIENIDFMKMFIQCLKYREIVKGFSDIYAIDFEAQTIDCKSFPPLSELEPLMIAHFLYLLEPLLKKGLKQSSIQREDNLSSKIKGKLLFNKNLKMNGVKGRLDRAFCRFSEISPDCIENRILKKALHICESFLSRQGYTGLEVPLAHCRRFFNSVSDEVSYYQYAHLKINPIYKEYKPALKVAIDIIRLRRLNEGHISFAPPHWINMALLFEKYVYSLMLDNNVNWGKMEYQFNTGYSHSVDFLLVDKQAVADTKYKQVYDTLNESGYDYDNIQQLSAYARSNNVVNKLDLADKIPECLIIYPQQNAYKEFIIENKIPIKGFVKFYKLGVPLPIKETNIVKD